MDTSYLLTNFTTIPQCWRISTILVKKKPVLNITLSMTDNILVQICIEELHESLWMPQFLWCPPLPQLPPHSMLGGNQSLYGENSKILITIAKNICALLIKSSAVWYLAGIWSGKPSIRITIIKVTEFCCRSWYMTITSSSGC